MAMESTPSAACARKASRTLHVGGDVGAAEAVDRLFGIAHEEERTRPERERRPVAGVTFCRRLAAEAPENLGLERVGVLELVDEDVD